MYKQNTKCKSSYNHWPNESHLKVLHRTALNGTPIFSVESTFPGIELNRKKSVQVFFSGKKISGSENLG